MNIGISCFNVFSKPKYSAQISFGASHNDPRQEIIMSNMKLVDKILREKFWYIDFQEQEDIRGAGMVALCSAVSDFDFSSDENFEEFIRDCIYNAMQEAVRADRRYKFKKISLDKELSKDNDCSLANIVEDSRELKPGEAAPDRIICMPCNLPEVIAALYTTGYGEQAEINRNGMFLSISDSSGLDPKQVDEERRRKLSGILEEAVEKLPPKLKDIITRVFFKRESFKDIARDENMTENPLRIRCKVALEELRLILSLGIPSQRFTKDMMNYVFENEDHVNDFKNVLRGLTPQQEETFKLRSGIEETTGGNFEYSGIPKSRKEIAASCGLSVNGVKALLKEARGKIRRSPEVVRMLPEYKKLPAYDGNITPDIIDYIFENDERVETLQKIFKRFDPMQRRCVELHFRITENPEGKYEHENNRNFMLFPEIAQELGINKSDVRNLFYKSLRVIREDRSFVKIVQDYTKAYYEGKITPDVIKYIFDDNERAKVFQITLEKLPPKQRMYFELFFGITETPDGQYKYSGKSLSLGKIAKKDDIYLSAVGRAVIAANSKIKEDRAFVNMMSDYKEPLQGVEWITPDLLSYLFENEKNLEVLQKIFDNLPRLQKAYFLLYYGITQMPDGKYQYDGFGMTQQEIADKFGVLDTTINKSLLKAKETIAKNKDFLKIASGYTRLSPYDGEITSDVVKYVLEDEKGAEFLQKILDKLPQKQRQYFELFSCITKSPDGQYKCNGTPMHRLEIAEKNGVYMSTVYYSLESVFEKLRKNRTFVNIMKKYEANKHSD